MLELIEANYVKVIERINASLSRSGRQVGDVSLVGVSKRQPIEKMNAYIKACSKYNQPVIFGENYVKEFKDKKENLRGKFDAHLIGPLQSNKSKEAVRLFSLIQSVHKSELAAALNREAVKQDKVQDILLQVNISSDSAKSGFKTQDLIPFLRGEFRHFSNLRLKGLMTITRFYENVEDTRSDYQKMFATYKELELELGKLDIERTDKLELSMGMTADFEIAIEEGATLVRVGTGIFGERLYCAE